MKKWFISYAGPIFILLLTACSSLVVPPVAPQATLDSTPATSTPTDTPLPALPPSPTSSAIPSATPTELPTATTPPTTTPSPTISPTATPSTPYATILEQSNCRYGPGKAYLYSHGLYENDTAEIHGRNYSGRWLWIKPFNLERHCWAAASVMDVTGEVMGLPIVETRLPQSTLYGPPEEVETTRRGDVVIIAWEEVWMTQDDYRGYLVEALVCQAGNLIPYAIHVDSTKVEIPDEQGCGLASSGKLYTVEKHGYTTPVDIPWP